jgi:hypothetical protein
MRFRRQAGRYKLSFGIGLLPRSALPLFRPPAHVSDLAQADSAFARRRGVRGDGQREDVLPLPNRPGRFTALRLQ